MKARVTTAKPVPAEGNPQQRVERRMPHRVPCRVRLVEPTTGEVRTVMGETINLSAGGVAIQVGVDVPVGTWAETLIPHAHGDPLFLCGTVVHSRRTMHAHYEIGIAMSDAAPPAFV
ncbi:MAG: PilZ domain-containing protein [Phycisphaerae bacterium]|nr:PilZ domain-containing protein [Phycisphaerae bacterium]